MHLVLGPRGLGLIQPRFSGCVEPMFWLRGGLNPISRLVKEDGMDDMLTPLTVAISGVHMSSFYFFLGTSSSSHLLEGARHRPAVPEHTAGHRHPLEAEVARSSRCSLEPVLVRAGGPPSSSSTISSPPELRHLTSELVRATSPWSSCSTISVPLLRHVYVAISQLRLALVLRLAPRQWPAHETERTRRRCGSARSARFGESSSTRI